MSSVQVLMTNSLCFFSCRKSLRFFSAHILKLCVFSQKCARKTQNADQKLSLPATYGQTNVQINTIPVTYGQTNVQTVLQYLCTCIDILRGLGLVVKHCTTYQGIACSIPHSPNLNYVKVKVDMYWYYPGKWSHVLYTWHFINLVCHVGGRSSLLHYGSQTQKLTICMPRPQIGMSVCVIK